MAHEILQQPKIVTAIGERVPGAMAKHVRPHVCQDLREFPLAR